MLAVSSDDAATLQKFQAATGAPGRFVPDTDGKIMKAFHAKVPLLKYASRITFVIGEGRKVLAVQTGSEAIDPAGAIQACPVHGP